MMMKGELALSDFCVLMKCNFDADKLMANQILACSWHKLENAKSSGRVLSSSGGLGSFGLLQQT